MPDNKIVAYHGTLADIAQKIVAEQRFKPSKKPIEWLGHGIYFFAYKEHAEQWAKTEAAKPQNYGCIPAVVNAELCYCDQELLDLDDPAKMSVFDAEVRELLMVAGYTISEERDLSRREKHEIWCLACNLFRAAHPELGIIVYTFPQRQNYPLYYNNQRQICVSKPHIIQHIQKEA